MSRVFISLDYLYFVELRILRYEPHFLNQRLTDPLLVSLSLMSSTIYE
jgi:hypothetical protein